MNIHRTYDFFANWNLITTNSKLSQILEHLEAQEKKPKCPLCMGRIESDAKICMHCKSKLIWLPVFEQRFPFSLEDAKEDYLAVLQESLNQMLRNGTLDVENEVNFYVSVAMSKTATAMPPRTKFDRMLSLTNSLESMIAAAQVLGCKTNAVEIDFERIRMFMQKSEAKIKTHENQVRKVVQKYYEKRDLKIAIALIAIFFSPIAICFLWSWLAFGI